MKRTSEGLDIKSKGGFLGKLAMLRGATYVYFEQKQETLTNPRRNRRILAILVFISLFLGIAMVAIGASNLYGVRYWYDPTPQGPEAFQYYITLTFLGSVWILTSLFGFLGIYERKRVFTQAYMMMSIVFGQGLFQIYIVWLAMDRILEPMDRAYWNNAEGTKEETETRIARYHMTFILLSGFLQTACGILAFLLLLRTKQTRGFARIYEENVREHETETAKIRRPFV